MRKIIEYLAVVAIGTASAYTIATATANKVAASLEGSAQTIREATGQ
jgi:hypothetical protein